jgi:NAD(P)-dependent dehydrogenase (short-subunit alcohol dehydrogenase family)/acyl carrier protein
VREVEERVCGSLLKAVQAVAGRKWKRAPRLYVMSRCGQEVTGSEELNVSQAMMWGMGRVIANEHAEVWGGMIDIEEGSQEEISQAAEEVMRADEEKEVSYRGMKRYVARMVRSLPGGERQEVKVSGEGVYVITGGSGGLGLEAGLWLVEKGARKVVLVSRRGANEAGREKIEEMRRKGARVEEVRCDIAERREVREMIKEIEGRGEEIKGVIEAAGELADGVVMRQRWEGFRKGMRAKVEGVWNIEEEVGEKEMEMMVMYSSATAVLGTPGQSNHAAGNAFMDMVARERRRRGKAGVSVNWGAWKEVGAAAERGVGARVAGAGIGEISREGGIRAMEEVLSRGSVQVVVLPIDWNVVKSTARVSPLFSDLVRQETGYDTPRQAHARNGEGEFSREKLLAATSEEQSTLLQDYLSARIASVLKVPQSKLDLQKPLSRLGIDSLMAIELRTRVQADLGVLIPIADLLKGPSVAQLTSQLLEQVASESVSESIGGQGDEMADDEDWEVLKL